MDEFNITKDKWTCPRLTKAEFRKVIGEEIYDKYFIHVPVISWTGRLQPTKNN